MHLSDLGDPLVFKEKEMYYWRKQGDNTIGVPTDDDGTWKALIERTESAEVAVNIYYEILLILVSALLSEACRSYDSFSRSQKTTTLVRDHPTGRITANETRLVRSVRSRFAF